jgi:hypothetical protein
MKFGTWKPCVVVVAIPLLALFAQGELQHVDMYGPVMPPGLESVHIQIGEAASPVEKRVAKLLRDRLREGGDSNVTVSDGESDAGPEPYLVVLLGRAEHHAAIRQHMEEHRIPPLTDLAPGPEGYLVQRLSYSRLLAVGKDDRGCLYAVGEILRQTRFLPDGLQMPMELNVRTAPAFEIRGTQYGQSRTARELAKVRPWTEEETQRVILDYALAGANIFDTHPGPMFDFIKSYGLMTATDAPVNSAGGEVPEEWEAEESIGRKGYVCLSVPEARAHMLERCEEMFRDSPYFDLVRFKGGDGGGCECDRCDPYGQPFIETVAEMATIVHKYHPDSRIFIVNQKFDDADDRAIFDYLQAEPRDWLWAFGYGPGSDATTWQPGHRQTHRMDLFRYPGFGPYALYPREIIRELPPRHELVYFNEITHWKYAQHAYIQMYPRADRNGDLPPHWSHEIYERRPDQYLTKVYARQTWYAWPRYYHRVFNDLMHYGVGDITHSSGHHDHFNQWMWQRLLWSPRRTPEDIVDEYCRTWFGIDAAEQMAEAIFLMERNMQEIPGEPLDEKESVAVFSTIVNSQQAKVCGLPPEKQWVWLMYQQKALVDRYVQEDVRRQKAAVQDIEAELETANAQDDSALTAMLARLEELEETEEMAAWREHAEGLGARSNEFFGMRSEGIFNLEHDYVGLGWLKRQLERALEASGEERAEHVRLIADYDDPGPGGFYDNFGTANDAPNAVFGYPYDHGQPYLNEMLDEGNRPSQSSMHFTQDEDQGVTLHYRDLEPDAAYRIRFTFVRPWFQERYADRMNQKSQTIYADDKVLAEDVELPLKMSDFFTYDIPEAATADGELIIRFERGEDVARGDRVSREQWRNAGGWGTLVSESWLMKQ